MHTNERGLVTVARAFHDPPAEYTVRTRLGSCRFTMAGGLHGDHSVPHEQRDWRARHRPWGHPGPGGRPVRQSRRAARGPAWVAPARGPRREAVDRPGDARRP